MCILVLSWGLLAGTIAENDELSDHSYQVGTIMLINYTTVAMFSTVYVGFIACGVDLMNPIENAPWSCLYSLIGLLLVPSSIVQLVLVVAMYAKEGNQLSKHDTAFCWISAIIGISYALGIIGYNFGNKIADNIKKKKESESERRYKIGTEKLNNLIEQGIFDSELFIQVYKDRIIKEQPLEPIEMAFLTKHFEKSILTNINGNLINQEACCPICQNEWEQEKLYYELPKCQHCFDKDCLEQWLGQSIFCPICKQNIRKHLIQALSHPEPSVAIQPLIVTPDLEPDRVGDSAEEPRIAIVL